MRKRDSPFKLVIWDLFQARVKVILYVDVYFYSQFNVRELGTPISRSLSSNLIVNFLVSSALFLDKQKSVDPTNKR